MHMMCTSSTQICHHFDENIVHIKGSTSVLCVTIAYDSSSETLGGLDLTTFRVLGVRQNSHLNRGRLDLAVPITPSAPNRQNRNQVCWNICAGVRWSTPYSEVV